ncbi:MAG TPA: cytochrome c [Terriglobales bacterium]|nr:cytochrome c [Terriglobales bacterium]
MNHWFNVEKPGHEKAQISMFSLLTACVCLTLCACSASRPGDIETMVAQEAKRVAITGKNLKNPLPDTPEVVKTGQEHFSHHCQVCHGLDGHNTGVPFANKMSPNVPELSDHSVQDFTDGQLKIIIQNGIRFSGMPAWQGILDDNEMWAMVRFIRHLPPKGSLGVPAVFQESEEEHHHAEGEEHHH